MSFDQLPPDITNLTFSNHWELVVGLVVGVVPWLINQINNIRKSNEEHDLSLLEREKEYSKLLNRRLEEKIQEITELEERLDSKDLHIQNISEQLLQARLESAGDVPPLEIVKNLIISDSGVSFAKMRLGPKDYRMIRVSLGFARAFLAGPPAIYDNRKDVEFFGEELASKFIEDDESVYINQVGSPVKDIITNSPSGATGVFYGRKYYVRLPDGADVIIGTGEFIPNES